MKQEGPAIPGKPAGGQRLWIVVVCALLGAGAGFALAFEKRVLDANSLTNEALPANIDRKAAPFFDFVNAKTSIRVFGVLVFEEKGPKEELMARWRHYCRLIAGGLALTGLFVGAGFGFGVQRIIRNRNS